MIQKVLKIGSSVGVTIPKKALKQLGIKAGDDINVDVDERRMRVTLEAVGKVNSELIDWTDAFIKRYRPALDSLKNK